MIDRFEIFDFLSTSLEISEIDRKSFFGTTSTRVERIAGAPLSSLKKEEFTVNYLPMKNMTEIWHTCQNLDLDKILVLNLTSM